MLFLTPNRNMLVGKFVNWEGVLAVFWEHVIFNFKRVEIRKISAVLWAKLYFQMSDLFGWFLLALRFSATNSGIKKMERVGLKKYFQKKNCKYEILNHLYFGPSFVFWGTALGRFSQSFFFLFRPWSTMVTDIFTQHPHDKKASYGPASKTCISEVSGTNLFYHSRMSKI